VNKYNKKGESMSKTIDPIIETTNGKVEGVRQNDIHIFKGIPYAAPPVGDRRWLAPEPVEPWTGVFQARSFGSVVPQGPSPLENIMMGFKPEESQSEDCLFLNIWSPGLDDARRPVLFWIHGGGFRRGAGSRPIYDGSSLLKRGDTVLVTINYRLGPFGFLSLNEATGGRITATGNEGMLDQIMALEWVRDNIATFGGDPNNVTVFGESAGGMSIGALLSMPRAQGLFHKAILQSGAANTAHTVDRAQMVTEQFLKLADLKTDDVDALRSVTAERLVTADNEFIPGFMPWQPVIEGTILLKSPLEAIRAGSGGEIPIMVGSTLDEWKLMAGLNPEITALDENGLMEQCKDLIPANKVEGMIEIYRSALERRGVEITPGEIFLAIQTDRVFRIPAIRLAEAHQRNNQLAFNYLFTWTSPAFEGKLGACHAIDVGFVFGTHEDKFFGSGPKADALSEKVQDGWVTFARTGNPSCDSLGEWPEYKESKATMLLGAQCTAAEAPYEEERRAWHSIPDTAIGSL
jgi:para-nitrobenzyl esterase